MFYGFLWIEFNFCEYESVEIWEKFEQEGLVIFEVLPQENMAKNYLFDISKKDKWRVMIG